MRQDLVGSLAAACPQAWRDLGGDPLDTAMAFSPDCGDGWSPLLCKRPANHVWHQASASAATPAPDDAPDRPA
jgi:hypothetical protein